MLPDWTAAFLVTRDGGHSSTPQRWDDISEMDSDGERERGGVRVGWGEGGKGGVGGCGRERASRVRSSERRGEDLGSLGGWQGGACAQIARRGWRGRGEEARRQQRRCDGGRRQRRQCSGGGDTRVRRGGRVAIRGRVTENGRTDRFSRPGSVHLWARRGEGQGGQASSTDEMGAQAGEGRREREWGRRGGRGRGEGGEKARGESEETM